MSNQIGGRHNASSTQITLAHMQCATTKQTNKTDKHISVPQINIKGITNKPTNTKSLIKQLARTT